MSKITGGWQKAAVYDPSTGTTVQLNLISTEFSEFEPANITNETTTGLIYGGQESTLTIGFFDSGGLSQLDTWNEDGTLLNAVIYGQEECVLWYEDEPINFERGVGVNARDGASVHQLTLTHIGHEPAIRQGVNITDAYVKTQGFDTGWQDSDSDNEADGYTFTNIESVTFAGGTQTIDNSSGAGTVEILIPFPIADVKLSLTATQTLNSGSPTQELVFENFANAAQATASQSIATGPVTVTETSPSSTYYVKAVLATSGSAFNVDVEDPMLASGDQSSYVEY